MHLIPLRRTLSVALMATCFAALPSEAASKRRSVRVSPAPIQLTAEITGTVRDSVTNEPVVSAKVQVGENSKLTDTAGKYTLRNVHSAGNIVVEIARSGYVTQTQTITTGGNHTLDIRLVPLPTVSVRKTDNSVVQLDSDTIRFGYSIPFSGYRDAEFEEFCKADGTAVTIDRSQISRITGPATMLRFAPCCPNVDTLKVNITLKTGETFDAYFVDACNGNPNIDLLGRDHKSAKAQYIPFTSIAEIIFP